MKQGLAIGVGALVLGAVAFGVLSDKIGARTPGAAVLARMGEARVDVSEFGALLDLVRAGAAQDADLALPELAGAVREETLRKGLLARAGAAGLPQREDIAARARRAHDQVIVDAWLAERSAPQADYPPETLARAYYEANRSAFAVPTRYRLAQIWLPRPPQASAVAEARKQAEAIARQAADADADFAVLAKAHSRHAESAAQGGALGWVSEQLVRPELRKAVADLESGQVSRPVELEDGWHIVRLEAREAAHTQSFEAARERIGAALRNEQAAANRTAYIAGLLRESPITVDEIALQDFSARRAGTPTSR